MDISLSVLGPLAKNLILSMANQKSESRHAIVWTNPKPARDEAQVRPQNAASTSASEDSSNPRVIPTLCTFPHAHDDDALAQHESSNGKKKWLQKLDSLTRNDRRAFTLYHAHVR